MNPNNNGFPFFNGFGFGGAGAGGGHGGQFNGLPFANIPPTTTTTTQTQNPMMSAAMQTLQMQTMASQMMYGYMCQNLGFSNFPNPLVPHNQMVPQRPSVPSSPFLSHSSTPGLLNSVGRESSSSPFLSSHPSTPGFQIMPPQSSTPQIFPTTPSPFLQPSPSHHSYSNPPSNSGQYSFITTSAEKNKKQKSSRKSKKSEFEDSGNFMLGRASDFFKPSESFGTETFGGTSTSSEARSEVTTSSGAFSKTSEAATSSEVSTSSGVSKDSEVSTTSSKTLTSSEDSEAPTSSEVSQIQKKGPDASTSSKDEKTSPEVPEDFASFLASTSSGPPSSKPSTSSKSNLEEILESPENHIHFNEEGEDDVDKMFGISDDEILNPRSHQSTRGDLSPITFTPPDSPEKAMTLDEIFGGTKVDVSKNESKNSKKFLRPKDPVIAKKVEMPKKIPIYKLNNTARLSLESKEAARKKDPTYDPFEFKSDDEDEEFGTKKGKKKTEMEEKSEMKQKVVMPKYISGFGFEPKVVEKEKESPMVEEVKKIGRVDPDFFSLADRLRSEKDAEMECSLFKITQSTSTECAKDRNSEDSESDDVIAEDSEEPPPMAKKRRSSSLESDESSDMDTWTPGPVKKNRASEEKVIENHGPCISEEFQERLSIFGRAEESLPKGTFLIFKPDILKENCALWRIDAASSLLQKFEVFKDFKSGEDVYRGSNTYSGWCAKVCPYFLRIQVKIVKKTGKFGIVVKPEIPISQLFCAVSIEYFKNPRTFFYESEVEEKEKIDENLEDDSRKISLETLMNTYLVQVFNKDHVKNLLEKNDFEYTRSLTEIDLVNWQCEELIENQVEIGLKFRKWIAKFTRINVVNTGYYTLTKCQICQVHKTQRLVHFFDKTSYTPNFEIIKKSSKNPVVVDAILCEKCCRAVESLHKIQHFAVHIFRTCRDKLEQIGTTDSELNSTEMTKLAKADRKWINSVVQEYCSFWDRVLEEFL